MASRHRMSRRQRIAFQIDERHADRAHRDDRDLRAEEQREPGNGISANPNPVIDCVAAANAVSSDDREEHGRSCATDRTSYARPRSLRRAGRRGHDVRFGPGVFGDTRSRRGRPRPVLDPDRMRARRRRSGRRTRRERRRRGPPSGSSPLAAVRRSATTTHEDTIGDMEACSRNACSTAGTITASALATAARGTRVVRALRVAPRAPLLDVGPQVRRPISYAEVLQHDAVSQCRAARRPTRDPGSRDRHPASAASRCSERMSRRRPPAAARRGPRTPAARVRRRSASAGVLQRRGSLARARSSARARGDAVAVLVPVPVVDEVEPGPVGLLHPQHEVQESAPQRSTQGSSGRLLDRAEDVERRRRRPRTRRPRTGFPA